MIEREECLPNDGVGDQHADHKDAWIFDAGSDNSNTTNFPGHMVPYLSLTLFNLILSKRVTD